MQGGQIAADLVVGGQAQDIGAGVSKVVVTPADNFPVDHQNLGGRVCCPANLESFVDLRQLSLETVEAEGAGKFCVTANSC